MHREGGGKGVQPAFIDFAEHHALRVADAQRNHVHHLPGDGDSRVAHLFGVSHGGAKRPPRVVLV